MRENKRERERKELERESVGKGEVNGPVDSMG